MHGAALDGGAGRRHNVAMTLRFLVAALLSPWLACTAALAQTPRPVLLRPDRVFDGSAMHPGWAVLVEGDRIAAAGPDLAVPADAETIALPGTTLLPGLIDSHVHLFLHPYDETSWNDQVLKEPLALRVARAVAAARATLAAGFTTVRDLGTEGAGDADAGLKLAIERGVVPGPRVLSANRAIVATGSYGPRGYAFAMPQGAEEASGAGVVEAARRQMGEGADVVKLYADYHWQGGAGSTPTFTIEEMRGAVAAAHDAGRKVAAHAGTAEGMRRATEAGVDTVEHGDAGTPAVFRLMKEKGVAYCPTLAATEAITRYRGWNGSAPEPAAIVAKRASFARGGGERRHLVCGRRHRRFRAWPQRARGGADGRLGAAAAARAPDRDERQRRRAGTGRPGRGDPAGVAGRPGRGGGRSRRRHRRAGAGAAGDESGRDGRARIGALTAGRAVIDLSNQSHRTDPRLF